MVAPTGEATNLPARPFVLAFMARGLWNDRWFVSESRVPIYPEIKHTAHLKQMTRSDDGIEAVVVAFVVLLNRAISDTVEESNEKTLHRDNLTARQYREVLVSRTLLGSSTEGLFLVHESTIAIAVKETYPVKCTLTNLVRSMQNTRSR